MPWYSTKRSTSRGTRSAFLESRAVRLLCTHPAALKGIELHHFMVAGDKAVPGLHIPFQPLLCGENKVQHSTSPCWLLYPLEKEGMLSRNLLNCLCPAKLSLQKISGWWRPPIRARACKNMRLLLSISEGLIH